MSLVQGYSSEEDDTTVNHGEDAFGLSAISSKRARVETNAVSKVETSAPDVLAEVWVILSHTELILRLLHL